MDDLKINELSLKMKDINFSFNECTDDEKDHIRNYVYLNGEKCACNCSRNLRLAEHFVYMCSPYIENSNISLMSEVPYISLYNQLQHAQHIYSKCTCCERHSFIRSHLID